MNEQRGYRVRSPKNGEGPTVLAVSPLNQNHIFELHSAGTCLGEQVAERTYTKRLADVTAKLAIAGFSLYPLHDETLLVTRWNMSRTLPSVEAAERFLRMVGGSA